MTAAAAAPRELPVGELLSLNGRSAVVTGAGQGIGEAVSRRLAEAGASVFLVDLDGERAEAVAREIDASAPGSIAAGRLDVRDPEEIDREFARAKEELGTVDLLVNNAGVYPPATVGELEPERWRAVLDVNLDGPLACSRAAIPLMRSSNAGGVIVNATSTGQARAQTPGMAAYIASKHGLDGLTKSLAVELGPDGIRVLSVAPTLVQTPGIAALSSGEDVSELSGRIDSMIPLRRIGAPDDVAKVVLFCVSDLASFVSGSTIYVDGGGMAL